MQHNRLFKRLLSGSAMVAITALAMAESASAQAAGETSTATPQATSTASEDQLQDIVVTARRTSEALQTTPVAVTALSGESLVQRQIASVSDLGRTAPSLSVGGGGTGPGSLVFLAIRGQAQNSPTSFSDASVGIYIDGVYVARPVVGNLGFLDMASAEVLRGPQGTLFGRNTTGGALNLTSQKPTDRFEGYAKLGTGNYGQRLVEGVVNIPLTDELATRFAGRYDRHAGYFKNPFLGRRQGDVDGEYYLRGSLKWEPTSLPVTLNIIGDYTHYRDHGAGVSTVAINPDGALASFYALSQAGTPGYENFNFGNAGPITQYLNPQFVPADQRQFLLSNSWRTVYGAPQTGNPKIDNPFSLTKAGSITANLDIDLGDVSIKSITGYRKSHSANSQDLSGTPTGVGGFVSIYHNHQFSEELQLSGSLGRLDYIGGIYYFRESGTEETQSAILYNTPAENFRGSLANYYAESKGVFAQVNYNATDSLRITGGIRYTWDTRFINRHGVDDYRAADPICSGGINAGLPASVAPCDPPNKVKFKYPAWTAGIDYKLSPDIFVYAKTSGASMSGGYNGRPVPPEYSSAFDPEHVKDVEVGIKGEFLNRRLRTNFAFFHAWQSKVQRIVTTTFVDGDGQTQLTQFVSNSGKVRTYGVEFEGTLIPWRGMELTGSAAYLHAAYVRGSRTENQLVNGLVVPVDRSGEPVTQAPKYTANAGATQTFDIDSGKLAFHIDYAYTAARYFDYFTTGDPAQAAAVAIGNESARNKAYSLVNGQISLQMDSGIEFAIWGKNLANEKWFSNAFNSYTGLGSSEQFPSAPRTYGGTVTVRF
ncbi:TonB-dependent receptor [Sphingobium baderi]|nr:TonB-dependent receptor [Sphingobium baderi]